MAAVNYYGDALGFASKDPNRDIYIVMAEVNQDGFIFIYVSNDIQGDKDIVLESAR